MVFSEYAEGFVNQFIFNNMSGHILQRTFLVLLTMIIVGKSNAQNQPNYSTFSVTSEKIDLAPYLLESPNRVVPDFRIMNGVNQQILVGFQHKDNAIILRLNEEGKRIGNPVELVDYWLCAMYPMPDESLVVLASKDHDNDYITNYPNTLYFLRISPEGKISTTNRIFGGEGHGSEKSWFDGRVKDAQIAFNGDRFGIYFEVQKNWAKPGEEADIHNGDMFVQTDLSGNIIPETEHFWTASHSSTLQLTAMPNQEFCTMTIADAYPYGLQVFNRNTNENFVAWPPKEDWITYENCQSSNAAGLLKYMDTKEGYHIAILGTLDHPNLAWDTKVDPLFLKMDLQGNIVQKKYLTVTPETGESTISVTPLGNNYLIAFGEGNVYENDWKPGTFSLCIVDPNGDFIVEPTPVMHAFNTDSNLIPVSEKEFIWCTGNNGSQELELHKIIFE
jgi:hypothetical protein